MGSTQERDAALSPLNDWGGAHRKNKLGNRSRPITSSSGKWINAVGNTPAAGPESSDYRSLLEEMDRLAEGASAGALGPASQEGP